MQPGRGVVLSGRANESVAGFSASSPSRRVGDVLLLAWIGARNLALSVPECEILLYVKREMPEVADYLVHFIRPSTV
jgi:hypothetical protein